MRIVGLVLQDYNCSIEFVRSPFLVQEWEMVNSTTGSRWETLRLDVVESSSSYYREADFIVFNSGHWWTHPKTSKGLFQLSFNTKFGHAKFSSFR